MPSRLVSCLLPPPLFFLPRFFLFCRSSPDEFDASSPFPLACRADRCRNSCPLPLGLATEERVEHATKTGSIVNYLLQPLFFPSSFFFPPLFSPPLPPQLSSSSTSSAPLRLDQLLSPHSLGRSRLTSAEPTSLPSASAAPLSAVPRLLSNTSPPLRGEKGQGARRRLRSIRWRQSSRPRRSRPPPPPQQRETASSESHVGTVVSRNPKRLPPHLPASVSRAASLASAPSRPLCLARRHRCCRISLPPPLLLLPPLPLAGAKLGRWPTIVASGHWLADTHQSVSPAPARSRGSGYRQAGCLLRPRPVVSRLLPRPLLARPGLVALERGVPRRGARSLAVLHHPLFAAAPEGVPANVD
ncbi:hypothetical protein CDD83_9267 [Cordyceps sp. RAO-2017]|nr:hypothetical protein CDD83_9267 [Cordyceps sp. RAO-2017]